MRTRSEDSGSGNV